MAAKESSKQEHVAQIKKQCESTAGKYKAKYQLGDQKTCKAQGEKAAAKYSSESAKFKAFRAKSKGRRKRQLEIHSKAKGKKFVCTYTSYKAPEVKAPANSQNQVERCWSKFDSTGSGRINAKQLESLCAKLGLLDAKDCQAKCTNKDGECDVNSFLTWWFSGQTDAKNEPNKDKSAKVAEAKSKRTKSDFYKSTHDDKAARKQAGAKYEEHKKSFKAHRAKNKQKGRRRTVSVYTPKRAKLGVIEYDLTKYKAVQAPERTRRQVEKIWTKFDKQGTGTIDAKQYDELCTRIGVKAPECKEGSVKLTDFVTWWFGQDAGTQNKPDESDSSYQKKRNLAKKIRGSRPNHNCSNKPGIRKSTRNPSRRTSRSELRKFIKTARSTRDASPVHNRTIVYTAKPEAKYQCEYTYNTYRPLACDFGNQNFGYLSKAWNKVDEVGSGRIHHSKVDSLLKNLGVKDTPTTRAYSKKKGTITYEGFVRWFHKGETSDEKPVVDQSKKAKVETIKKQCQSTASKYQARYKGSPKKQVEKRQQDAKQKYKARSGELREHIKKAASPQESSLEVKWARRDQAGKKTKESFNYDLSNYKPLYLDNATKQEKAQVEKCFDKYDAKKNGQVDEGELKKLVEELGLSKATDLKNLYAKCADGKITQDNFLRWWFSAKRETRKKAPSAPPSPGKKASKNKVKLMNNKQRQEARYQARLKAQAKSLQLKKFVKASPKKSILAARDFSVIFVNKALASES